MEIDARQEEKYLLWDTTDIKVLGEGTVLVRSNNSGELFVRKTMDIDMLPLHKRLMTLQSEYLVKIFDACEIDGQCVILEEYIRGQTVETVVEAGVIRPNAAAYYMTDLCGGLQMLHTHSIVHRDIKPANCMITSDGKLKIIDFDISRFFNTDAPRDTTILGTAGYAAPEQFGFAQTDSKSDIYAAGVLFQYMLTGEVLDRRAIKGPYAKIIERCVSLDPEDRYRSAQALRRDISAAIKINNRPVRRRLRNIPGFRSINPIASFFAVIFYLYDFSIQLLYMFMWWSVDKLEMLKNLGIMHVLFTLPFIFYTDFLDLSLHIPIIKNKKRRTRRTVLAAIGTVVLFIGILLDAAFMTVPGYG